MFSSLNVLHKQEEDLRRCTQGLACHHIQMAGSLPSFTHLSQTTPSTLSSWLVQREPLLSTSLSPKMQLLQHFAHDCSSRLLNKGSLYLNVVESDNTVQLLGFTYFPCILCAFDVCTFAFEKARCCLHWFFSMPSQLACFDKYRLNKGPRQWLGIDAYLSSRGLSVIMLNWFL